MPDNLEKLQQQHSAWVAENLRIDLTRGKPSQDMVAICDDIDQLAGDDYRVAGIETRNYGEPMGLPPMRQWFAERYQVPWEWVLAGGNSSLELMYQAVLRGWQFGYAGQPPWRSGASAFLCPVPGYDRHFAICQHFGIEMIQVPLLGDGPDMDEVERLLRERDDIRGMWCVPRHSNPSGETYSDATVARIAQLGNLASPDFRILWDNAYAFHDFHPDRAPALRSLHAALVEAGTEDSALIFGSLSKITRAASGVALCAASESNLQGLMETRTVATLGGDKVNQLRHLKFFERHTLEQVMQKHAEYMRPRFELVARHLQEVNDFCRFSDPSGGYFVSLHTPAGQAARVAQLCAEAGLAITPPGSAYPLGEDAEQSHLRIAPSFPSLDDLETAMRILVNSLKLANQLHN